MQLRKAGIYIILLCFLFNTMGYYVIYELDIYLAKKEMSSATKGQGRKIVRLSMDNNLYSKCCKRTDSKEFQFNGKLYDIIFEKNISNGKVFYCYQDVREEKIVAGLKNSESIKIHLSILEQFIKIAISHKHEISHDEIFNAVDFHPYTFIVKSAGLRSWNPPPELV